MNVKQIVEQYLRKHKCDGLIDEEYQCACSTDSIFENCFCGCNYDYCVPAVKRRRMVNGKRRTILVPVE